MKTIKKVLLLVETSRTFGRQIIQGVSHFVMEHHDWDIMFQDRSMCERFPGFLSDWNGDGIIARTGNEKAFRQLQRLNIPIVEIYGDGKKLMPHVQCDEPGSCRLVADHFHERAFTNFAFFSLGHNWWSRQRYGAFRESVKEYGAHCELSPMSKIRNDISLSVLWWKGCEEETFQWIRKLPKPIGIFCPWDMHAFFLLNVCHQRGIAIPEDVAVVGYGNNADFCRVSSPPLSSLAPNGRAIGYRAAELLHGAFRGEALPAETTLIPATHIEVRQSSDTVAVTDPSVARAVHFIRRNIVRSSITVRDVARHVGVSRTTLAVRFRTTLGHSPDDEIQRARITQAMNLLRETNFSITQIVNQLGYSNVANFSRMFRARVGMTPSQYRTANKQL